MQSLEHRSCDPGLRWDAIGGIVRGDRFEVAEAKPYSAGAKGSRDLMRRLLPWTCVRPSKSWRRRKSTPLRRMDKQGVALLCVGCLMLGLAEPVGCWRLHPAATAQSAVLVKGPVQIQICTALGSRPQEMGGGTASKDVWAGGLCRLQLAKNAT